MERKTGDLRKRLHLVCVIILAVGLSAALLIYLSAEEGPTIGEGDQVIIVDGQAYPIPLSSSRMHARELQRFGGKAAVLFDRFNRWFASLWQGRSLAITVAWLSVFLSLGVYLFAGFLSPGPDPAIRGDDNPHERK